MYGIIQALDNTRKVLVENHIEFKSLAIHKEGDRKDNQKVLYKPEKTICALEETSQGKQTPPNPKPKMAGSQKGKVCQSS